MLIPLALHLHNPEQAWWFLLPVAVGLWAWRSHSLGRKQLAGFLHARQRAARLAGNRSGIGTWRLVLGVAGLLLLTVALLGPTHGSSLMPVQRRGVDIVVCLDTSRSMLAQDVGENRLQEAKKELTGLMEVLTGDRMALIAFAGDVRQVAPLTRDMQTLAWFMESLGPEDNRLGGTDLGGAIDEALELFDGRSGSHEAILLVTDGEDLEGYGLEAAQRASENGIRVYVLGMGTLGGAKVPAEQGGWVQDENGMDVITRLESSTLEALAGETGGLYIQAEGTVLPLEQLYTRGFSRLEGRKYEQGMEEIASDRYQWPLLFGLILFAMPWVLSGRKRTARVQSETRTTPQSSQHAPVGSGTDVAVAGARDAVDRDGASQETTTPSEAQKA